MTEVCFRLKIKGDVTMDSKAHRPVTVECFRAVVGGMLEWPPLLRLETETQGANLSKSHVLAELDFGLSQEAVCPSLLVRTQAPSSSLPH